MTQAAAGGENDIRLRVYGEKGMLDWSHREASYLRVALQGEPARIIGRGDPFLPPDIIAAGRTPRGHPEGLREAFANIYAEMAQERMARALGETVPDFPYPRIDGRRAHDGVHRGVRRVAGTGQMGRRGQAAGLRRGVAATRNSRLENRVPAAVRVMRRSKSRLTSVRARNRGAIGGIASAHASRIRKSQLALERSLLDDGGPTSRSGAPRTC